MRYRPSIEFACFEDFLVAFGLKGPDTWYEYEKFLVAVIDDALKDFNTCALEKGYDEAQRAWYSNVVTKLEATKEALEVEWP